MERVVKFRGKTQDGKWVYGDLIHSGSDEIAILEFDAPCLEAVTDVVPDTVGQFTGMHDKDGKEIYFGDIVRDKYGDIGSVIWFSDWSIRVDWGGGDIHFIDPEWGLEVIGNIIDNPNLLTNGRD